MNFKLHQSVIPLSGWKIRYIVWFAPKNSLGQNCFSKQSLFSGHLCGQRNFKAETYQLCLSLWDTIGPVEAGGQGMNHRKHVTLQNPMFPLLKHYREQCGRRQMVPDVSDSCAQLKTIILNIFPELLSWVLCIFKQV